MRLAVMRSFQSLVGVRLELFLGIFQSVKGGSDCCTHRNALVPKLTLLLLKSGDNLTGGNVTNRRFGIR